MIVINIDKRKMGVHICGMSFKQFLTLCKIIETFEHSKYLNARSLSGELHLPFHWIVHWNQQVVSLVFMTWDQVYMLAVMLAVMLADSKEAPEILKALDCAIEMAIR